MKDVITQHCTLCKDTDCEEGCPVDALRESNNMLMIDPDDVDSGFGAGSHATRPPQS